MTREPRTEWRAQAAIVRGVPTIHATRAWMVPPPTRNPRPGVIARAVRALIAYL